MKESYKIGRYGLEPGESRTFRSGQRYRLFFVVQGMCRIDIEGRDESCRAPDILFIKPGRAQTAAAGGQSCCVLLGVDIPVRSLEVLSDATCDLVQDFNSAPFGTMVIHAEMRASMLLRNMVAKLETLRSENVQLGAALYEKSLFTAFLISFLRTCVQSDQVHQAHQRKTLIIDDVFGYISRHLTEDLSLKKLEEVFFISGEHISREFKKNTGITLHAYITRMRIDLSRRYLLQGMSVRDVCQLCGFSSYNHFFKVFKKECGMTPRAYYQSVR